MASLFKRPRSLLFPAFVLLFVFTLLALDESLKPGRFSRIVTSRPTTAVATQLPTRVSAFHYLVPASAPNIKLCYNVVSAAVNRFPAPLILGWKGEGLMDAAETHLAKLRAIQNYLQGLSTDEDDDLVLIVDGYDIIMQLPVEVMIERYFTIRQDSDAHLAERFKLSVGELHARGIRNTIFWGPDKICWPIDWAAPRCWAAPSSQMPANAFGPDQDTGAMTTNDPRWLNSGTVIGPVGDLRRYINVTMAEIARTYDETFENSESDQYYLANVWGRQEYHRSVQALALREAAGDDNETVAGMAEWLAPSEEHRPPAPVEGEEATEFHVAIEYESALFQTKAGYEAYFGYLKFDQPGFTARMGVDMHDEGASFVPYSISMPAAVYAALTRVYEAGVKSSSALLASRSLPAEERGDVAGSGEERAGRRSEGEDEDEDEDGDAPVHQATSTTSRSRLPASEWIRSVNLGVNYVTRHVYGLWHCTASKDPIDGEYRELWFFPFVASLLRANALASRAGDALTSVEMDGRAWMPRLQYPVESKKTKTTTKSEGPESSISGLEYGGVFTDFPGEEFLSFGQLCGEWQEELFAGELGTPLQATPEVKQSE